MSTVHENFARCSNIWLMWHPVTWWSNKLPNKLKYYLFWQSHHRCHITRSLLYRALPDRGLPLKTSAKFSDFLTTPCPQIHATSCPKVAYYVCFWRYPPPPLSADVLKMEAPISCILSYLSHACFTASSCDIGSSNEPRDPTEKIHCDFTTLGFSRLRYLTIMILVWDETHCVTSGAKIQVLALHTRDGKVMYPVDEEDCTQEME